MIPERRAVNELNHTTIPASYLQSFQAAHWGQRVCGGMAELRNYKKTGELPEWRQIHYFIITGKLKGLELSRQSARREKAEQGESYRCLYMVLSCFQLSAD